jgi:hypothetical protein
VDDNCSAYNCWNCIDYCVVVFIPGTTLVGLLGGDFYNCQNGISFPTSQRPKKVNEGTISHLNESEEGVTTFSNIVNNSVVGVWRRITSFDGTKWYATYITSSQRFNGFYFFAYGDDVVIPSSDCYESNC